MGSTGATDRVADDIRAAILDARLQPGSRLRQEDLADTFGTSRLPIRLALKRLESEGLVLLVPNSGAWVARLDLNECIEIYKIREQLEPLALLEGACSIGPGTLDRMDDLVDRMAHSVDVEEFLSLDREFHLLSYSGTDMPRLVAMIERFWNTTQHYRRAYARVVGLDGLLLVHCEHRLMAASIRRQDAIDASRILRGHIRRTRLELQKNVAVFPDARTRKKPGGRTKHRTT